MLLPDGGLRCSEALPVHLTRVLPARSMMIKEPTCGKAIRFTDATSRQSFAGMYEPVGLQLLLARNALSQGGSDQEFVGNAIRAAPVDLEESHDLLVTHLLPALLPIETVAADAADAVAPVAFDQPEAAGRAAQDAIVRALRALIPVAGHAFVPLLRLAPIAVHVPTACRLNFGVQDEDLVVQRSLPLGVGYAAENRLHHEVGVRHRPNQAGQQPVLHERLVHRQVASLERHILEEAGQRRLQGGEARTDCMPTVFRAEEAPHETEERQLEHLFHWPWWDRLSIRRHPRTNKRQRECAVLFSHVLDLGKGVEMPGSRVLERCRGLVFARYAAVAFEEEQASTVVAAATLQAQHRPCVFHEVHLCTRRDIHAQTGQAAHGHDSPARRVGTANGFTGASVGFLDDPLHVGRPAAHANPRVASRPGLPLRGLLFVLALLGFGLAGVIVRDGAIEIDNPPGFHADDARAAILHEGASLQVLYLPGDRKSHRSLPPLLLVRGQHCPGRQDGILLAPFDPDARAQRVQLLQHCSSLVGLSVRANVSLHRLARHAVAQHSKKR
eukprot:scaffold4335_cov220-Pinguiococcus_pyrenoidosus.AAC.1